MYSIRVKYSFDAVHALRESDALLESPHSHTFEVEVEVSSKELDASGCVVDFRDLDARMADVLGQLNNTNLCENQLLKGKSPSAEAIAEVLFQKLDEAVDTNLAHVISVCVWEDDRHAGCYRRDL